MLTTLVYPGAGCDVAILLHHKDMNIYNNYILIDALPEHQYYEEDPYTKDVESFYNKLNLEFDSQCDVLIDAYPWTWKNSKYIYYYNTYDFDAKINSVEAMDLLIRGYQPNNTFIDSYTWRNIWLANDSRLPIRFKGQKNAYKLDVIDNDDSSLIWTDSDSE